MRAYYILQNEIEDRVVVTDKTDRTVATFHIESEALAFIALLRCGINVDVACCLATI